MYKSMYNHRGDERVSNSSHAVVRKFIAAMSDGKITGDLVTDDFHVWIVGSDQMADRKSYIDGIALLPRVFPDRLRFAIKSLTAEDDRVIAEFSGEGTTRGGEVYRNDYLYLFRLRDGKVCFLAEWLNLDAMRGVLIPAMQEVVGAG